MFGCNIFRLASKKRLGILYPPPFKTGYGFVLNILPGEKENGISLGSLCTSCLPAHGIIIRELCSPFYTPRDILQATWNTSATWSRGTCTTCWLRSTSGTRRTRGRFRRFSHPCWTWTRKTGRRPPSACWIRGCWRSGWPLLRDEQPRHSPVTHSYPGVGPNPTQTQK